MLFASGELRRYPAEPKPKEKIMIAGTLRACCVCVLVLLYCYGTAFSMTEEEAARQWDAVRETAGESSFLINLFLTERMPGAFPHKIKARFKKIATLDDAKLLLNILSDPSRKKEHTSVFILLQLIELDVNYVQLIENHFNRAQNQKLRNRLFNLMTSQDTIHSYLAAIRSIQYVQSAFDNNEAISYLTYFIRYKNQEARRAILDNASSHSTITRAASYIALTNYADEEVMSFIDQAISQENATLSHDAPPETNKMIESKHSNLSLKGILQTTQKALRKPKKTINS
ncbi:MAG: hypothetical protein D3909_13345, partial [Candidatus Electrothrix sp. ATG1]|nr:hypothetical protein [Candidatus Electrothrix sp. ATG1]